MKLNRVIAVASIAISTISVADQSGVQFEVVLMRDGKVVASPKVVGEFGRTVALAQGSVMKFEGSASAPDGEGNSLTAVKLFLFESGQMGAPKEMSMLANLKLTPSFEYSVPSANSHRTGTPYRS